MGVQIERSYLIFSFNHWPFYFLSYVVVVHSLFHTLARYRAAYTGVLVGYGGLCLLWVPLAAWMMPNEPFQVGQVSLLNRRWRFIVRQRRGGESEIGGVVG